LQLPAEAAEPESALVLEWVVEWVLEWVVASG